MAKLVEDPLRLLDRLAHDALGHHGRRGLGDGTACRHEPDVGDHVFLHLQVQGDIVSAEGVEAFGCPVCVL